ncbi:hypothetical protein Gotur_033226 [Gossypium turneri]
MFRRRLRDLNIIQIPPNSEETNSDQHTAIGSSDVLNIVDEPVEIQTKNGPLQEPRVLAGYLGIIERNFNLLSINYKSCHHMPDSNKNHALDNIKNNFII